MSTFMLSDESTSRLALSIKTWDGEGLGDPDAEDSIANLSADELADRLHQMNRDAVEERYPCEAAPLLYVCGPRCPTPVVLYKLLRSYLYQCSEGEIPERKLFRELEAVAHELAGRIVHALPEYLNSPWGE